MAGRWSPTSIASCQRPSPFSTGIPSIRTATADLLLAPTLFPAGPVYLLTGNPVLQYNAALLVWWALSGWAMYVFAYALLRSHAGAALAAIVFTFCPFRTDFFLEFQMELAFPIPLALLCLWRFLEEPRWRPLLGLVAFVWIEALASMYYAIILGLCLIVVTGLHLLVRPRTWSWRVVQRGAVGGLVLGAALGPFLVPYVQNYRELHLERALRQPAHHSADVMTYFETGPARLYHFAPSGHIAETSLFMGFVALALAVAACVLPDDGAPPAAHRPLAERRLRWAMTAGLGVAGLGFAVRLVWHDALSRLHAPGPQSFLNAVLLLGVGRIGLEGWWAARAGHSRMPLGARELRWICLLLGVLFFDLSLGPVIHYRRQTVGKGLYAHLYPYLLPLHAMRITSRIGVIVVLAVSLLAGLGLRMLQARLGRPAARAAVAILAVGLLLAEYAPMPLPYRPLAWEDPPGVYRALAADPDDVAVLEWPQGNEDWDDAFTFRSITHWKRITNGASGFLPELSRDLSIELSRPDSPDDRFPTVEARRYLLGIHSLRYLVVHNALLGRAELEKWQRLRAEPWARYVGRFGEDDLYQLSGDWRSTEIDKLFSWDYARTRTEIAFEFRPVGPAARTRWIEVALNGRLIGRRDGAEGWNVVRLPLAGPLHHSAPNVVSIRWHYQHPVSGNGRAIGRTGVEAPTDVGVVSGGKLHGDRAAITVNGLEHAQDRRGYNLVALDPTSGEVRWAEGFDTFASPDAAHRLAEAIRGTPAGSIVIAAVKDEASAQLTADAVDALRSIGASQDLRGRYRAGHLVIGVKGAPPGTAVEQIGDRRLEAWLGTPPDGAGVEVRGFALR